MAGTSGERREAADMAYRAVEEQDRVQRAGEGLDEGARGCPVVVPPASF